MTGWPDPVAGSTSAPARILLVDDEEALVRAIARVLMSGGYEVATAGDGRRAAELLAHTSFDAVVSDIDMPKMNGVQLLQTVRQLDLDVPVILMTGDPGLTTAMQAVALGAFRYLTKPIDQGRLRNALVGPRHDGS